MKRRELTGVLSLEPILSGLGLLLFSEQAQAGRQLEEPLADGKADTVIRTAALVFELPER